MPSFKFKIIKLARFNYPLLSSVRCLLIGGAKRDRTADLLRAKQALSQLSYGPNKIGRPE